MVRVLYIWAAFFLISGCAVDKATVSTADDLSPAYLQEQAMIEDTEISRLLNQYRPLYENEVGSKIAYVPEPLMFDKPESELGNLVADALRYRASREERTFVHLSLIGMSSFITYFEAGDLTLGDVLEFMPYKNNLVLLKLSGIQVYQLCQEIAERGGVPVSGIRFRLEDDKPRDILVNSGVIDFSGEYWLATSSWIADGGENFLSLKNPAERKDLDLSVRDVYVDYLKNQRIIAPQKDGRIRE